MKVKKIENCVMSLKNLGLIAWIRNRIWIQIEKKNLDPDKTYPDVKH
jgi:hypothetical protein